MRQQADPAVMTLDQTVLLHPGEQRVSSRRRFHPKTDIRYLPSPWGRLANGLSTCATCRPGDLGMETPFPFGTASSQRRGSRVCYRRDVASCVRPREGHAEDVLV